MTYIFGIQNVAPILSSFRTNPFYALNYQPDHAEASPPRGLCFFNVISLPIVTNSVKSEKNGIAMTGIFEHRKSTSYTFLSKTIFFLFAINPTMLMRRPYF